MNNLIQALMSQYDNQIVNLSKITSEFTPEEIRQTIAELVASEKLELAHALSEAGLSLYPKSVDILAISALVVELKSDWVTAEELLKQLIDVQGDLVKPFTLRQLVRVQRCLCEIGRAMNTVNKALKMYPENSDLLKEKLELSTIVGNQLMVESSGIVQ